MKRGLAAPVVRLSILTVLLGAGCNSQLPVDHVGDAGPDAGDPGGFMRGGVPTDAGSSTTGDASGADGAAAGGNTPDTGNAMDVAMADVPDRSDAERAVDAGPDLPLPAADAGATGSDAAADAQAVLRPPCPVGMLECHEVCAPLEGICLVDLLDLGGGDCTLASFKFCSAKPDRPDCSRIMRKVHVPANELGALKTLCQSKFPALKAEVCGLGTFPGYRVGLTVHAYNPDGSYGSSTTVAVENCP
jgi:hypothetical protein